MRTIFEMLGRLVIAFISAMLLMFNEPLIKTTVPTLAPYSINIIYTGLVLLAIWIFMPLINVLFDLNAEL